MTRAAWLAATLLTATATACAPAKPPTPTPTPTLAAAPDAAVASQDEQLAAIQRAMNDLAGASQQCWAVAATERFDIDGEITAQIEIAAPATVTLVKDTTRNVKLAGCLTKLLAAYPWAPPLRGQTIQLPFKFSAPDGQNVVDRALVPWVGQGNISVAVLLDRNNTGNAAASLLEVAIAAGGTTGLRWAQRAELWYFLGAGEVRSVAGGTHAVAAGDMMYAPTGAAREVAATAGDLHAMIAIVPGGPEGGARAGALPTPEVMGYTSAPMSPSVLPASGATHVAGAVQFTKPSAPIAAAVITLAAGTRLASLPTATELLYVLSGTGTLTGDGAIVPVTATGAVDLPAASKVAFTATTEVRAVQVVANLRGDAKP